MIGVQQNEYSARISHKCGQCGKKTKVKNSVVLVDKSVRVDFYCDCGMIYPITVG